MKHKDLTVILDEIYPLVSKSCKNKISSYRQHMNKFINDRHEDLYAIAPYRRIYYNDNDSKSLFSSLGLNQMQIKNIIKKTDFYNIRRLSYNVAKDEDVAILTCMVKYFTENKNTKMLDLCLINLCFSGKMYPSIHYGSFKYVQPIEYKFVMDYVVNNMLNNKFDLKVHGTVIGAIRSIAETWVDTYKDRIDSFTDEDFLYITLQLRSRIKSFMKNIATLYYKAYEDKDQYINFNSDNYSDEEFRLADSDSLKAERIIDATMNKISTLSVNYKYCKMSANSSVKTDEIKNIIEYIIKNDTKNLSRVREFVSLIIYTYFQNSKYKDVRNVEFIRYTTQPKPNAKDKNIIRIKEITEGFLDESSERFRTRKRRLATKNDYIRAVTMYFTLLIHYTSL